MKQHIKAALLILGATVLSLLAILAPRIFPQLAMPVEKRDFRIGDRLPPSTENVPIGQRAGARDGMTAPFQQISWDELVPRDWDPLKDFKGLKIENLQDSDPKAIKALEVLQEAWNKAPVRADLHGMKVRIPGFVIPLERKGDAMTEFLLVPYFGACIHTPPPPSNQIIHGISTTPVTGFRSMDAAWVSGELQAIRSSTGFGTAGYRLTALQVEPYDNGAPEGGKK